MTCTCALLLLVLTAVQDLLDLQQLEAQLSAHLAKSSDSVPSALAAIQNLQQQQQELLIMQEDHLQTAAAFPTQQVTKALSVSLLTCLLACWPAWEHPSDCSHEG